MSDEARWRKEARNTANVIFTISLNTVKSHILFQRGVLHNERWHISIATPASLQEPFHTTDKWSVLVSSDSSWRKLKSLLDFNYLFGRGDVNQFCPLFADTKTSDWLMTHATCPRVALNLRNQNQRKKHTQPPHFKGGESQYLAFNDQGQVKVRTLSKEVKLD